jgi:hypothetical protein
MNRKTYEIDGETFEVVDPEKLGDFSIGDMWIELSAEQVRLVNFRVNLADKMRSDLCKKFFYVPPADGTAKPL